MFAVAQWKLVPHWPRYRKKLLDKFLVTHQSLGSNVVMLLIGLDGVCCLSICANFIFLNFS